MTANEIISEWRGECRHDGNLIIFANAIKCTGCRQVANSKEELFSYLSQYDSDPAAWDEALYSTIAEKGLADSFLDDLFDIVAFQKNNQTFVMTWEALTSTPAQKARALAKSITDGRKDERD